MAQQDPSVSAPRNSQYAADLKTYAATFAPVASGLLANIKTARLNSISGVVTPDGVAVEDLEVPVRPERLDYQGETDGWPGGTHNCEYQTQDGWTGNVYCDFTADVSIWTACVSTDAYGDAVSCRNTWIAGVGPQFDTDWTKSSATIADWTQLSTNPLGTGA